MGTTESIFADTEDNVPEVYNNSRSSQHQEIPTTTDVPLSHPPPPRRRRLPHSTPSVSVPIRQRTSFQLNGMVLGMSKTGKRTLLQRLEGKEPDFFENTKASTSTNRQRNENDEEMTASVMTEVTVSYQPAIHLPKFNHDESIQLHVQAMKKPNITRHDHHLNNHLNNKRNNNSNQTKAQYDYHFYVIVVDPRHDRTKVQKYITKRLQDIVRLQGYENSVTDVSSDTEQPVKSTSFHVTPQYRPFCVSILRNFYDRIHHDGPSSASSSTTTTATTTTTTTQSMHSIIPISDLTMWTMDVLGKYPRVLEDVQIPPLLQCIDTSLRNCYGLSALHHFIYQSYVQNKQYLVQQELLHIEEAIVISRREAASLIVPYDEYIENIERLLQGGGSNASTSTTVPSSNHSAGSTSSTVLSTNPISVDGNDNDDVEIATIIGNSNMNRRQIINTQIPRHRTMLGEATTSAPPSVQPSINNNNKVKDALEAFLESDSDDGDVDKDDNDNRHDDNDRLNTKTTKQSDDDDDDDSVGDEDFYFEEVAKVDNEVNNDLSCTDTNQKLPIQNTAPTKETLSSDSDGSHHEQTTDSQSETVGDKIEVPSTILPEGGAGDEHLSPHTQINDIAESVAIASSNTTKDIVASSNTSPPTNAETDNDDDDDSDFYVEEAVTEDNVSSTEAPDQGTSMNSDLGQVTQTDTVQAVNCDQMADQNGKSSLPDDTISPNEVSNDINDEVIHNVDTTRKSIVPDRPVTNTLDTKNDQISDAARAAIELARQDFERMMLDQHPLSGQVQDDESIRNVPPPKKRKKDKKNKKSNAKEGKKSKRNDS
jgi:hypothetical protein